MSFEQQKIYSPSIFIGREKEISNFKKILNESNGSWILHLEGEGGIGKTKLLQEYN